MHIINTDWSSQQPSLRAIVGESMGNKSIRS